MDAPFLSVSSGRQIPAELLSVICDLLFSDRDIGTLNAILRTGSLGYGVAGPALYARLAIDNRLPMLLEGIEDGSGRKRGALRCAQHISFSVTNAKMLSSC